MTIPSRKIPLYFHSLEFPVRVLDEQGKALFLMATSADLLDLIKQDGVIAIGTYRRIKHFRLLLRTPGERQALRAKFKDRYYPKAEDNKTFLLLGKTYGHHPGHCEAFSRGRGTLSCHAL